MDQKKERKIFNLMISWDSETYAIDDIYINIYRTESYIETIKNTK